MYFFHEFLDKYRYFPLPTLQKGCVGVLLGWTPSFWGVPSNPAFSVILEFISHLFLNPKCEDFSGEDMILGNHCWPLLQEFWRLVSYPTFFSFSKFCIFLNFCVFIWFSFFPLCFSPTLRQEPVPSFGFIWVPITATAGTTMGISKDQIWTWQFSVSIIFYTSCITNFSSSIYLQTINVCV